MKKPIFEDCSFNFKHEGCFYNVKFIPTESKLYYKIIVQDWNIDKPLYESSAFIEKVNKTAAMYHICLALKIKS